jgi:DNA replication terminus site-binding protein
MRYSLEQLNAIERFSALVEQLEKDTLELKRLLRSSEVLNAKAFNIDRIPSDKEADQALDHIPVDVLTGGSAVKAIDFAFSDWYGEEGYSTKFVHRTPGAIVINSDKPQSIVDAVARCNETKQLLSAETIKMGPPSERFKLIHAHHHMMIQLQLTRKIHALTCPPDIHSVTFSWGFKTEIKKLSLDQACDIINRLRNGQSAAQAYDTSWPALIDDEVARLQSLPQGTEFRLRRVLNVRPQANIRYRLSAAQREDRQKTLERGGKVKQPTIAREAHSPIIIINPKDSVILGDLKDYSAFERSQRKERSGGITAKEPITPLAPIYQVLRPSV